MSLAPESLRLILIVSPDTDENVSSDRIHAGIRGGVTLVQLRLKGMATGTQVRLAARLLPLCQRTGTPLVINDRPDVALAIGADGAHVGPADLTPLLARRVLGDAGLGVSARTPSRLCLAEEARADYIGTGALRSTISKSDAVVIGRHGIARLAATTRIPMVAVGGIRPHDVPALRRAGLAGVAVLNGILGADDPERAARGYSDAWG